jgi:ribonuclease P protein subunit POP4
MKITPDIIRYEFIGTAAHVVAPTRLPWIKRQSYQETRNTFTLKGEGKTKSVIKQSAVFDFTFNDGTTVEIDGKLLVGRSEDRLKKSIKRLW